MHVYMYTAEHNLIGSSSELEAAGGGNHPTFLQKFALHSMSISYLTEVILTAPMYAQESKYLAKSFTRKTHHIQ